MQPPDHPTRGTAHSGRVFAFTMMAGFVFVALVGAWKDVGLLVRGGQIMAVAAFLAGVLAPRHLEPVRRGWMAFGEAIGRVTTPIMLAVVYYLVITPTGLIRRAVTRRRGGSPASYWEQRPPMHPKSRMERQF